MQFIGRGGMADEDGSEPGVENPAGAGEGDMHHIHKPKKLHGFREIAGEIGIIVIGVCIALAAEQIVEKLHEARLAEETQVIARSELQATLKDFLNRRVTQACIDRRLDEVTALLAASDQPGYKPPSWIGRPQTWGLNTAGWDAASQGGRVALLQETEQAQFGRLYSQLRALHELQRDEQKAWAEIRQLEDQPRVDPQMRATVRSALQQARLLNWNIRVDLEQSEARAEKLSIMEPNPHLKGSPAMCLPTSTSRAAAIAQGNSFFGDKLGEP